MTPSPLAQLDQTVLELIEHSPQGMVPHTPAYQDALGRLCAAHQVYASADHKGGYVSVRSLAGLPAFYAHNLEAFLTGAGGAGGTGEEELEADAEVFNRYVLSLPEALRANAEASRALVVARKVHHRSKLGAGVVHDPVHSLFLVPGAGPNPGLPGNYLYGLVFQTAEDVATGTWRVHVHDRADGAALCEVASGAEAWTRVAEVLECAPFLLSELEMLGFRSN